MGTPAHRALVEKLYRNTSEGQLSWVETASEDTFSVNFSSYSLSLTEVDRSPDGPDYHFAIADSNGRVVDSFSDDDVLADTGDDRGAFYLKIRQLFTMARRTALGSERAVQEILKALDEDYIPF